MARPGVDGLGQFLRRHLSQDEVDGGEVLAIKGIKFSVVRGTMLWAEPPAPIAAFGGQQRFARVLECGLGGGIRPSLLARFESVGVGFACIPEQFPGGDVFGMADPDVEIGVDPGSGENSGGGGKIAGGANRFRRSDRAEILIAPDACIKLAEKSAAVPRVVFPGIFAVEKKTNGQRLIARHALSEMAHAIVKIGSSGFGVHAAVDETDEVREMVIAK